MTTPIFDLDTLTEILKLGSLAVGKLMAIVPDYEWAPTGFIVDTEGRLSVIVLADQLQEESFRAVIEQSDVPIRYVGFVATAWMAHRKMPETVEDALDNRWTIPPSEDPEREEALLIEVASVDEIRVSRIPIERRPDSPPTLGQWEPMPGCPVIATLTDCQKLLVP